MAGCVFCKIVSGELPSYKVYEDDDVIVILDKYPASKGHLLVVTKKHYKGLHQTPPSIAAHAFAVAAALASYYKNRLSAPGVNVLNNDGGAAGQVVFHTHIHVIPRWSRTGPVFHGRAEITPSEAREVLEDLRDAPEAIRRYLKEALMATGAPGAS